MPLNKDFFVSYARKDNESGWITNFIEELVATHRQFSGNGEITYFFDKNAIRTGADWQHTLHEQIAHSRLFIAFVSPNYFGSAWCRKEWRAWIDAEIAKHILTAGVRPVYIVEVPGLTDDRVNEREFSRQLAEFLQVSGEDGERLVADTPVMVKHLRRRQMTHNQPFCDVHSFFAAGVDSLCREDLRQVLKELAADLNTHAELLKKAESSVSTIPCYNKNFSGRLDELLTLREHLNKDDRTGVIYGVHGLGGIGKTELAFTYAHGYASAYPGGRFLISCEDKSSLRDAILAQHDFAGRFAEAISEEQRKDPEAHYAAILRQLSRSLNDQGHVLLLLDNITDPSILNRQQTDKLMTLGPKLHLLATTRLAPIGDSRNWVSLHGLPDEDALELLEKHRVFENEEARAAAETIVERLGGFTLAVELVAAYLAANRESTSYSRVAKNLDLAKLEKIAGDGDYERVLHNQERQLSAVLGPVIEGLKPAELRALEYASLLHPDHVPLPWLRVLVTEDFSELVNPDELKDPWDALWLKLEKLSLFSRIKEERQTPRLLRAHRLVQELVRKKAEAHIDSLRLKVEKLVKERVDALKALTVWQDAKWELKPLEALANQWGDTCHPQAANLMNDVAERLETLGLFINAEILYRRALLFREQNLSPDHPQVAASLNNLAKVLTSTFRFGEAEPLLSRALGIYQQYSHDHPAVAATLTNLAMIFAETNQTGEAEAAFRQALTIFEASFGPNNTNVATALNNLAGLLMQTGAFEEAEPLMSRALSIMELDCGPNHPDVATTLNNLGYLLRETGKPDLAEQYFRRALAIYEQTFGPGHLDIALALNNLGDILRDTSRVDEAESLFRRALQIREQGLSADHPDVAQSLHNLAGLLGETDRISEAEILLRRAISILEQRCGSHPRFAEALYSLSSLLTRTNRLAEARPLLRRALAIYEESCVSDHADVARLTDLLGDILFKGNQTNEAEILFRRSVTIKEESLGSEHREVAVSLNNLASVLTYRNQASEAEALLSRAVAIANSSYGPNHPETMRFLQNLATCRKHLSRVSKWSPTHSTKVGRNDRCPCGSGKKYKKCCGS